MGSDEVLLGDATQFADAAAAAGVTVDLDVYERMPHAFHAGLLSPEPEQGRTARTFVRGVGPEYGRNLPRLR